MCGLASAPLFRTPKRAKAGTSLQHASATPPFQFSSFLVPAECRTGSSPPTKCPSPTGMVHLFLTTKFHASCPERKTETLESFHSFLGRAAKAETIRQSSSQQFDVLESQSLQSLLNKFHRLFQRLPSSFARATFDMLCHTTQGREVFDHLLGLPPFLPQVG